MSSPTDENTIYAYEVQQPVGMEIVPASGDRDWMDATDQRYAYRCLPMSVANRAGWVIHNPADFRATWNGGDKKSSLTIEFPSGARDPRVMSYFGYGVITISIPYLFRTPTEINLWVKGPGNYIKDAVQPLEGVVETDWNPTTFTMNWKVTRPNHPVEFKKGEPICMIVPVPRGVAESMNARQMPLSANPDLLANYELWQNDRATFLDQLLKRDESATKQGWQKDYFKGEMPTGESQANHQTKLTLSEFERG